MPTSKPMVHRGRLLINIGYKYNTWNDISFIVTYNSGITQEGLPYSYNQPDQLSNVAIRSVSHPLVM